MCTSIPAARKRITQYRSVLLLATHRGRLYLLRHAKLTLWAGIPAGSSYDGGFSMSFRRVVLIPLSLLFLISLSTPSNAAPAFMPRTPAISPDGSDVVFAFQGDLWNVSIEEDVRYD